MKKTICLICAICIVGSTFAGCKRQESKKESYSGPMVYYTYKVPVDCTRVDFNDTIRKLESRVQAFHSEAKVYKDDVDKIVVSIPRQYNADKVLKELGKPGSLYFCTKAESTPSKKDLNDKKYVEVKKAKNDPKQDPYVGFYKVWVTGNEVKNAKGKAIKDDKGQTQYVVSLEFDYKGTKTFGEMTSQNVGQQTFIIYDNKVLSAPKVNEPITGGDAQIDGQKDLNEAEQLASDIRIGALPVELKLVSVREK